MRAATALTFAVGLMVGLASPSGVYAAESGPLEGEQLLTGSGYGAWHVSLAKGDSVDFLVSAVGSEDPEERSRQTVVVFVFVVDGAGARLYSHAYAYVPGWVGTGEVFSIRLGSVHASSGQSVNVSDPGRFFGPGGGIRPSIGPFDRAADLYFGALSNEDFAVRYQLEGNLDGTRPDVLKGASIEIPKLSDMEGVVAVDSTAATGGVEMQWQRDVTAPSFLLVVPAYNFRERYPPRVNDVEIVDPSGAHMWANDDYAVWTSTVFHHLMSVPPYYYQGAWFDGIGLASGRPGHWSVRWPALAEPPMNSSPFRLWFVELES